MNTQIHRGIGMVEGLDMSIVEEGSKPLQGKATLRVNHWYVQHFRTLIRERRERTGETFVQARLVALRKITVELRLLPEDQRKHVLVALTQVNVQGET